MDNTIKEIHDNKNMDKILPDCFRGVMVDFQTLANEIGDFWKDKMPIMISEECGELMQAVSKYERVDRNSEQIKTDIINEMGDVIVTIFALAHYYQIPWKYIISRCDLKTHFCYDDRN